MPPTLAPADVLRLAPDASAAASGQGLAQVRHWVTHACDDGAVWGECQGSGKKPYQTQVDLGELAFKCSCPSRKFPCKHGLGLLLLYAAGPASVPRVERPTWVSEWLASRAARAEKKSAGPKEAKPVGAEAQAQRRDVRLKRIRDGMAELHRWVLDWVKLGIAAAPAKGWDHFDGQARRLIDAQAPGVARRVQELGSLAARGAGWQRPFLERLGMLHLLCRAAERFDELSPDERADLLAAFGVPVSQGELAQRPVVRDTWRVASQVVESEERLRVQRTWLYGSQSGRSALVLQFAHGGAPLDSSLVAGSVFDGDVVFHPGSGPRAVVRTAQVTCRPAVGPFGHDALGAALDAYSQALAVHPWVDRLLVVLREVIPTFTDGTWSIIDAAGAALPLAASEAIAWRLLAVSGGAALGMAGEFDGQVLTPLAVTANGTHHMLTDVEPQAA
jgi:hypothetical protein